MPDGLGDQRARDVESRCTERSLPRRHAPQHALAHHRGHATVHDRNAVAIMHHTAILYAVEKRIEADECRVNDADRTNRCALDHIGAYNSRWLRRGDGRLK